MLIPVELTEEPFKEFDEEVNDIDMVIELQNLRVRHPNWQD